MKKIYVSADGIYPHIPESLLDEAANTLVASIMRAFPHIEGNSVLTGRVYDALPHVDDIVAQYFGGAYLPKKELRLFVALTLEKVVMYDLVSGLMATAGTEDGSEEG